MLRTRSIHMLPCRYAFRMTSGIGSFNVPLLATSLATPLQSPNNPDAFLLLRSRYSKYQTPFYGLYLAACSPVRHMFAFPCESRLLPSTLVPRGRTLSFVPSFAPPTTWTTIWSKGSSSCNDLAPNRPAFCDNLAPNQPVPPRILSSSDFFPDAGQFPGIVTCSLLQV